MREIVFIIVMAVMIFVAFFFTQGYMIAEECQFHGYDGMTWGDSFLTPYCTYSNGTTILWQVRLEECKG